MALHPKADKAVAGQVGAPMKGDVIEVKVSGYGTMAGCVPVSTGWSMWSRTPFADINFKVLPQYGVIHQAVDWVFG